MTGDEMAEVRRRLRFSPVEFGREIGYNGNANTLSQTIRRYENGEKAIPPWVATAVRAIDSDSIGDEIYAVVGDLLTFETIGAIAERIVDHLVRESDMVDHGRDGRADKQQGRRQPGATHGEADNRRAEENSDE
jgi:hypothetical protein